MARRLAMIPTSAIETVPHNTDSIRAANNPGPNAARQPAIAQKYSGGCTSVTRRSRAIPAKLA